MLKTWNFEVLCRLNRATHWCLADNSKSDINWPKYVYKYLVINYDISTKKNGRNVRGKRAERPQKSGGTSEADVQEYGSSIYPLNTSIIAQKHVNSRGIC